MPAQVVSACGSLSTQANAVLHTQHMQWPSNPRTTEPSRSQQQPMPRLLRAATPGGPGKQLNSPRRIWPPPGHPRLPTPSTSPGLPGHPRLPSRYKSGSESTQYQATSPAGTYLFPAQRRIHLVRAIGSVPALPGTVPGRRCGGCWTPALYTGHRAVGRAAGPGSEAGHHPLILISC